MRWRWISRPGWRPPLSAGTLHLMVETVRTARRHHVELRGPIRAGMEGHDERIGYLILVGCSLTLRTASAGSGIQLAIVRAQSRACALSVMPGNNRRGSIRAQLPSNRNRFRWSL